MTFPMYDRSRAFAEVVRAKGGLPLRLAIKLDSSQGHDPNAQLIVMALCEILPRISERYMFIDVDLPDVPLVIASTPPRLRDYALSRLLAVCPWGRFGAVDGSVAYDHAIAVGRASFSKAHHTVNTMSSGWRCFLTEQGPISIEGHANPTAPVAAAALAASAVYARAEQLPGPDFEVNGWSLFDYGLPNDDGPQLPERIHVGRIFQAGLGGSANALLWILRHGPELQGSWRAFEPEPAEITNGNRYFFFTPPDEGQYKTTLAEKGFKPAQPQLDFRAEPVDARRRYHLVRESGLVLATVDDLQVRVDLQGAGAKLLITGGTSSQCLSLSRHCLSTIRQQEAGCMECVLGPPMQLSRRQREATVSFVMALLGSLLAAEFLKTFIAPEAVLKNTWSGFGFSPSKARVILRSPVADCATCASLAVDGSEERRQK